MAKNNVKKTITKSDWISSFTLIGKPKISDFTFKIDEKSEKSNWVYNSMNLGVDCGEKHGVVYCEMMGGYSAENAGEIFAHGKTEDGKDDFENQIKVAWEDRFDNDILEEIGDLSFITIGLEKTTNGQTFRRKFLSAYDAIAHIKEYMTPDMVINVRGTLRYSMYQDKVQVRKNITSIFLSNVEKENDFTARFTQSLLIDKASAALKPTYIDKNKGVLLVDARVLDYIKEYNGKEVKGQFPFRKQFEYKMDFTNEAQCKKIVDRLFKPKKGITQITFDGDLIEGGAIVTATLDDLTPEIKELLDIGVYTEEEAIAACSSNGVREQRMVIRTPATRKVTVNEKQVTVLQDFPERYTEDDLMLDCFIDDDSTNESTDNSGADDMSWLDQIDD